MYNLHPHDEEPQLLDRQILERILDAYDQPRPWTLKELQIHGEDEAVCASLRRLQRWGLADRIGFYVIASRAAIFYRDLQRLDG